MTRPIGDGAPDPLGVTPIGDGVNVAVWSSAASTIEFCLFDADGARELERIPLPARSGEIFHGAIGDVPVGTRYGLRAHGPFAPEAGQRFNPAKLLIDPYAEALDCIPRLHESMWGFDRADARADLGYDETDSAPFVPKGIVAAAAPTAPPPRREVAWSDTVIYELHVRGYTKLHPGLPESARGTFSGLAHPAAIAHLTTLGITTIELMPAAAWIDERHLPALGLGNYWGYNPIAMGAPDPRLAPGGWDEVRRAVEALHAAGLEVILDVVLNHSGESDELGPTLSLRGLDNAGYYRLRPGAPRYYANETGCGNILAFDRPMVVRYAVDMLRRWALRAGIDGFRFDLATSIARGESGFDAHAPLFAAIAADPVLRDLKMIAEPWDLGGWTAGQFPPSWGEWNDRFRDGVRRFWRGDSGAHRDLATRLAGSSDTMGSHGHPSRSVNFVTAHDGFTLADLVSYGHKRNDANGEQNRDGTDGNLSWNNGVEGPSDEAAVIEARRRDQRALLASLIFARGTPMLAMGAECGRSQAGNNNAYAQDNESSWLDWRTVDRHLAEFVRRALEVRRAHPALRDDRFLTGAAFDASGLPDIEWRAAQAPLASGQDWEAADGGTLIAVLATPWEAEAVDRVAVIVHRGAQAQPVQLPEPREGMEWRLLLASDGAPHPDDADRLECAARSVTVLAESPASAKRKPRPLDTALLDRLALAAGIAPDWWDVGGTRHQVSEGTKQALLAAMSIPAGTNAQARDGLRRLEEESARGPGGADWSAHRCHLPDRAQERRSFGISAQLYGIRRQGDQGVGDFGTLTRMIRLAANLGAESLGINPVHALFGPDRERASPYHPSDRRFLDPIYIDLAALGDLPGESGDVTRAFAKLSAAATVDYTRIWSLKRVALEARHAALTAAPDHPLSASLRAFAAEGGSRLERFAIHEALAEANPDSSWPGWPAALRDPASAAVRDFAAQHADRVNFQVFLQWLADRQFGACAAAASASGLGLGIYRDLAVGAAPDGAEAWADAGELARGVSIGAPPDPFSTDGQVWNLPPPNPHAARRNGFESFRALLAANMRHAGALRIDHAMSLTRLFWVPDGGRPADGAYVAYPLEDLIRVLAEESRRHRCMVIGEDLGTVPDGFRERMSAADVLSYRVLWFEREGAAFRSPRGFPAKAVACASTHDLPTLSGWWQGRDIEERLLLGQFSETRAVEDRALRRQEKEHLVQSLLDAGLLTAAPRTDAPMPVGLAAAIHAWVADSPALLVLAQLEDLAGETVSTNLPGTDRERPNWRRRLTVNLDDLLTKSDRARECLAALAKRRR